MFGILNVYKPKGKTSHDVIAILRRITKIKQIGHTGTLDPFAEGVLPVCIGKATRLIEYLNDDKAYIATVQFGSATDTYDIEGQVVKTSEYKITKNDLTSVLENFRGEIEQIPPIYSAIKVNGKKLYEYARKGEEVEIKPRKVTIDTLELLDFDEENQRAQIYISCSKGTYIRSIANDLGAELKVFGHLIKLVRVKAGDLTVEDSVNLEDLISANDIVSKLLNPIDFLHLSKYELNENQKEKVSHGMELNINLSDGLVVLTYKNTLAAIATVKNNRVKTNKVFI